MINERIIALPEEKRQRLISAGFKVFGLNEYKKASTEEIAREAGISKGYLFYYFLNKKSLYLYLYDQAMALARAQVLDETFQGITDFFEMMAYSSRRKALLAAQYPYLTEFMLRAFQSQREEVSDALHQKLAADIQASYRDAFQFLDLSPFKPGVDPVYVMRLLQWMGSGYLHDVQLTGKTPTVDEMVAEFDKIIDLMKKLCYREVSA